MKKTIGKNSSNEDEHSEHQIKPSIEIKMSQNNKEQQLLEISKSFNKEKKEDETHYEINNRLGDNEG